MEIETLILGLMHFHLVRKMNNVDSPGPESWTTKSTDCSDLLHCSDLLQICMSKEDWKNKIKKEAKNLHSMMDTKTKEEIWQLFLSEFKK
jgi:hypothetical protein